MVCYDIERREKLLMFKFEIPLSNIKEIEEM
jgi:hypothetical protein